MIIPDILEKTPEEVISKINIIECATDIIHLDIMDGLLFEGKSITDVKFLEDMENLLTYEFHFMVKNPLDYVKKRIDVVSKVILQIEAGFVDEFITRGKSLGYDVGLCVDIDTPAAVLEPYLNKINYIQFMSVKTGKSGQSFRPDALPKIENFRTLHPDITIQVDGSCNENTIPQLKAIGANNFAVNSAIFKSADPVQKKLELDELVK